MKPAIKKYPEKFVHQFTCMTTPCEVQLYASKLKDARKVAKQIEANTRRLEKKYNFFSDDSLVTALNRRSRSNIKIDPETLKVLARVQILAAKTEGCFDITMGTLKQCSKLDSIEAIEECRAKLHPFIGPDKWDLVNMEIQFANNKVMIDLGGVIKEYAVDQAGRIARRAKMSALVNFGGDIYVNGNKPDGSSFSVALKNPKDTTENIAILKLCDQGLTTSAHYERSKVVEGKQYSHIIGGSDVDSSAVKVLSATVISDSVLTSGIYSTSLMINSKLAIDKDIHIVLIDSELRIHQNISQQPDAFSKKAN